jgi:hypothetical protein
VVETSYRLFHRARATTTTQDPIVRFAFVIVILMDKRTYTRLTRVTPFDGANGGSLVIRFHLISSTSMSFLLGTLWLVLRWAVVARPRPRVGESPVDIPFSVRLVS